MTLSFPASPAFRFVFVMGLVNLFADTTYEGGASINGPFLSSLGATAAGISIIAGLGEFLGYSLRSISGYIADKTGKHWPITFIGYTINLVAVPAMAFASDWKTAAALILAERIGRAIRKPTVESMLSYTTNELGKGWVYGLNTALDETGAMLGPLIIAISLHSGGSYRGGYTLLLVSSVLALLSLTAARIVFPLPADLEKGRTAKATGFTRSYWLYTLAGACFAAGLMSFELLSFHLLSTKIVNENSIPIFLSFATGVSIVSSLVMGKLYDRIGLPTVLVAVFLSSLFSPFVFLGSFWTVLIGMVLWGIGYATQDTLLKAIIADVLPEGKRNLAFGLFYNGYAFGWLIGSVATGLLYTRSMFLLVGFAAAAQLISIPIFALAARANRSRKAANTFSQ
jgi:MFS family permease